jgi:hypothetical protein
MNKYLLTLLCTGSLMTLSGCEKADKTTPVVETEVAVAEAVPSTEVKTEATEIDVNAAEVVEKTVVVEEKQEAAVEKQDEKF